MRRGLESAKGPTTKDPVRYSTERRSEVNASWARLTSAIETPKVSRSEESSGASTTRRTRKRCSATPTTNSTGIDMRIERYGLRPKPLEEPERGVGAQHHERAVGHVEDAHDPVDQPETERHHRVDASRPGAGDHHLADHRRRDQDAHGPSEARRRPPETRRASGELIACPTPASGSAACRSRGRPATPSASSRPATGGHHLVGDLEAVLIDLVVAERRSWSRASGAARAPCRRPASWRASPPRRRSCSRRSRPPSDRTARGRTPSCRSSKNSWLPGYGSVGSHCVEP